MFLLESLVQTSHPSKLRLHKSGSFSLVLTIACKIHVSLQFIYTLVIQVELLPKQFDSVIV